MPKGEPDRPAGWPQKPKFLSGAASVEWDELAKQLDAEGRISSSDGPMLKGAAVAYGNAIDCEKRGKRRGISDDDWLRAQRAARIQWEAYRHFVNDMCLSAGTRGRASAKADNKRSTTEAFMARYE
jgi:phage terminase small subunit